MFHKHYRLPYTRPQYHKQSCNIILWENVPKIFHHHSPPYGDRLLQNSIAANRNWLKKQNSEGGSERKRGRVSVQLLLITLLASVLLLSHLPQQHRHVQVSTHAYSLHCTNPPTLCFLCPLPSALKQLQASSMKMSSLFILPA